MHPLSVAHIRVLSRVAEQNVYHHFLHWVFAKEIHPGKGSNHILFNNGTQLLIAEVLIPEALFGLGQRVITTIRIEVRIQHVSAFQLMIFGTMRFPLLSPFFRWWFKNSQKYCPAYTAKRRNPQIAPYCRMTKIIQGFIVCNGSDVAPLQSSEKN